MRTVWIPPVSDLQSAVDSLSDNLTTGLDFLAQRVLSAGDPQQCYAEGLIRAAAAATGKECRDLAAKLKATYGKDFSVNRFNADIRETRATLTKQSPTTLLTSETGAVKPILANAITQLSASVDLAFDSFSSFVTHQKPSPWGTDGRWRDIDDVAAANHLQHSGVSVSSALAHEAAYYLAHQKAFHPLRDWLVSLKWDGIPRICDLPAKYFGGPDTLYNQSICQAWMISAVARVIRPGCQVKYMLVLEGPQEQSKSRVLRALVNGHLDGDTGVQWFRDNMPDLDHKDLGQYMQGVWIIEIAELSAIRGKQWEKVKAFISSPRDTFRAPYGRNMQDYPRQCIFAGTTNEDQWGGDNSGLSRFWPLRPGKIDVDAVLCDRDQLWAEARFLYDEGRPWWLDAEQSQVARAEQEQRMPEDSWGARVSEACEWYIGMGQDSVTVSEILTKISEGPTMAPVVGRALSRLGWAMYREKDGAKMRRYLRPQ
jgi:predicted P-loop ATPase